jgi:cytochrome c2
MGMGSFISRMAAAALCTWLASGLALADVNAGAALIQKNGCQGCHGANFRGNSGFPALYGIEHRRSHTQIVAAIVHPTAPMPNFGFTAGQASDITEYLSSLDGGAAKAGPTITISPAHPQDQATVTVRFPGPAPKRVEAVAAMSMGGSAMNERAIELQRSSDGHTFVGKLSFPMGGAWTLRLTYAGTEIDRPLAVGQ